MRILILEDNAERQIEMTRSLRDRFPCYPIEYYSSAPELMSRLTTSGLDDVAAIALDHDLEMLTGPDGRWIDPGTGLDVAKLLAGIAPGPPIVIHTTNRPAGDSMQFQLEEGGWRVIRVIPYGDLDWIRETWGRAMRNAIVETIPTPLRETLATRS